jgi:hypothetical protein
MALGLDDENNAVRYETVMLLLSAYQSGQYSELLKWLDLVANGQV